MDAEERGRQACFLHPPTYSLVFYNGGVRAFDDPEPGSESVGFWGGVDLMRRSVQRIKPPRRAASASASIHLSAARAVVVSTATRPGVAGSR